MKIKYLILPIFFLAIACSSKDFKINYPENFSINTIELYYTRKSLASIDFEQYSLSNDILLNECGEILRGKNRAKQQGLQNLADDTKQILHQLVWNIIETDQEYYDLIDKPGNNSDLFDPGIYKIRIDYGEKILDITTSLDAVSSSGSPLEKKLLKLTRLLRGQSGGKLCGLSEFYGIGL